MYQVSQHEKTGNTEQVGLKLKGGTCEPTGFHHMTIDTGHCMWQDKSFVSEGITTFLAPIVKYAVESGQPVPIPADNQGLMMTVKRSGDAFRIDVFGDMGISRNKILTFGVALAPQTGLQLWDELHCVTGLELYGAHPYLSPQPLPKEPWIAVKLYVDFLTAGAFISAAGDFERCIAWTLASMFVPSQGSADRDDELSEPADECQCGEDVDIGFREALNLFEDTAFFDFTAQMGAVIKIFYENPSADEIKQVRKEKVRFGLFYENGVIFMLAKFGDFEWMDMPFNINLYAPDLVGIPEDWTPGLRFSVMVVFINRATGKQVGVRGVTLSPHFSEILVTLVRRQMAQPVSSEKHFEAIDSVYQRWGDSSKMARRALVYCTGGE